MTCPSACGASCVKVPAATVNNRGPSLSTWHAGKPRTSAIPTNCGRRGCLSAIHLARVCGERKRNFVGQHFWAGGFFVITVGRDEDAIRTYIRNHEKEDRRLEQLNLWR